MQLLSVVDEPIRLPIKFFCWNRSKWNYSSGNQTAELTNNCHVSFGYDGADYDVEGIKGGRML